MCATSPIEDLLKRGADVNDENAYGRTALHQAVKCSSEEVIAMLLLHGANMDARDVDGKTPLDIAEARPDLGYQRIDRKINRAVSYHKVSLTSEQR